MTDDKKRRDREAGLKSAATKGEEERKRAARMAAWTRKNGKNDKANPHSAENYYSRTGADRV
jgi:hypothetical protein